MNVFNFTWFIRYTFILISGYSLVWSSYAQSDNYEYFWHRDYQIGGISSGSCQDAIILNNGTIIASIRNTSTVDVDPAVEDRLVLSGTTVVAYDSQKNYLWHQTFNLLGGTTKLHVDSINDALYFYGYYLNSFDADPGPNVNTFTSVDQNSSFVIKLSINGDFHWARNIVNTTTTNSHVRLTGLETKPNGDLVLFGNQRRTVNYGSGGSSGILSASPSGSTTYPVSGFMVQWDSQGDFIDGIILGNGDSWCETNEIQLVNGNLFISMRGSGPVDFNPDPNEINLIGTPGSCSYIVKYDINLNYVSGVSYPFSQLPMIAKGSNNDIVITGKQNTQFDADPSSNVFMLVPGTNDLSRIYTIRLDEDFNFIWGQYNSLSGFNSGNHIVYLSDIAVATDGKIHTLGYVHFSNNFGGYQQMFLFQLSSSGQLIDINVFKHIGGNNNVYSHSLNINDKNAVVLGASNRACLDIMPGSDTLTTCLSGTSTKPLLIEFRSCSPQYFQVYDTICKGQTYLFGDQTLSESGIYKHRFIGQNNCDSVVTLHLNVKKLNTKILFPEYGNFACEDTTYTSYSWLNCNGVQSQILGEAFTFAPIDDDQYRVVINGNNCIDTSICVNVTQTSMIGSPVLEWGAPLDIFNVGSIRGLKVDKDGNFYVAGSFSYSQVNMQLFGDTTYFYQSANSMDLMVAKYDKDGAFLWAYPIGVQGTSAIQERALHVDFDIQGNVYFSGYYENNVDVDPDELNEIIMLDATPNSCCGNPASFLVKVNPQGQYVWHKKFGLSACTAAIAGLQITKDSSLIVFGSTGFQTGCNFNTINDPVLINGNFVIKYNLDGEYISHSTIPLATITAMIVDVDNNIILAGTITSTTDFGPGPGTTLITVSGSSLSKRNVLVSYNEQYQLNWVKGLNTHTTNFGSFDLATNPSGEIFLYGYSQGQINFTGGSSSVGFGAYNFIGAYLVKYESNGQFVKKFPYSDSDSKARLTIDHNNFIFLTGRSSNSSIVVYQNDNTQYPQYMTYVIKYSDFNDENWVFFIPNMYNIITPISQYGHESNTFYVISNSGITANPFNIDIDPSDNEYFIQSKGNYIAKFGTECTQIDTTVVINNTVATFTNNGYYYFKDCSTNQTVDSGFVNTFTPCQSGDYYAVIKKGQCYDTTSCFFIDVPVSINLTPGGTIEACQGQTIDFSVNHQGLCPAEYLWYFDNQLLASTQENTYSLPVSSFDDFYAAIVTINNDTIYSAPVMLNAGNGTTVELSLTACDVYTLSNGDVATSSGVYYDTIQVINGCDSIFVLNLTINNSVQTTENISSCDSYVLADGAVVTNSGTYSNTFATNSGCDSIVTINLSILSLDEILISLVAPNLLVVGSEFLSYQWLDCEDNFSPLINETSQIFEVANSGIYAVLVNSEFCSDTSSCFDLTSLHVDESHYQPDILIYPNPNSGKISVRLQDWDYNFTEFELISIDGKIIRHEQVQNTNNQYTLTYEGSPGIYFLRVRYDFLVSVYRLIKL